MNIQVTNVIAPAAPKSIEDTGLNVVMMRDILLKTIFRMNLELLPMAPGRRCSSLVKARRLATTALM